VGIEILCMLTKKLFFLLLVSVFTGQMLFSQSVAINTDGSTANASSILEIKSTAKGLLIPRMLKLQRTAITSPATGLMVYQTGPDSTGFYMYNGSSWEWAQTSVNNPPVAGSYWNLTGNGGTSSSSNFVGTTDNVPLRFRVANTWAGQIDNNDNTAFGMNGGQSVSSGQNNTALGSGALQNTNTGSGNTAIGANALLSNTSGSNNTAIGYGSSVTSGLSNATAIGANASVSQSNSIVLGDGTVNVGIGFPSPQHLLHVAGTVTCMKGASTHTGWFFNGTSNVDGVELVALGTDDAWISVQRGQYGNPLHLSKASSALNQGLIGFFINGTNVGHVDCNVAGTSVTYYTTSDIRLKENIRATNFGLDKLLKIGVADYNYKTDTKKALETGFLAQQLYTIYPQAVKKGGDDPKTDPWTIDYGRLTPILVKAVQDQQVLIQSLQESVKNLNEKLEQLTKATAIK